VADCQRELEIGLVVGSDVEERLDYLVVPLHDVGRPGPGIVELEGVDPEPTRCRQFSSDGLANRQSDRRVVGPEGS